MCRDGRLDASCALASLGPGRGTRDKPLRHTRSASGGLDARPSVSAVVDPSRSRTAPAHRTTPRATHNREPNPGPNPEPHPERGPNQVGLRVHHRLVDVLLHDADGPTLLHERTCPELTRTPRGPRAVRTCGLRVPAPCGLHVEEAQGSLPRGTVHRTHGLREPAWSVTHTLRALA